MRCTALVILTLLTGCSSEPPRSDAIVAKSVLESCLTAWKEGASNDSLQKREPPIFVVEDQWTDQAKLLDFSIADRSEFSGSSIRFDVELVFPSKKETVRYVVTTSPALTVARLDSQ